MKDEVNINFDRWSNDQINHLFANVADPDRISPALHSYRPLHARIDRTTERIVIDPPAAEDLPNYGEDRLTDDELMAEAYADLRRCRRVATLFLIVAALSLLGGMLFGLRGGH